MIQALHRIVQEVSAAADLPSALAITVNRIQEVMHTVACSIYLANEDEHTFVLMATAGLNPHAVGQVRLHQHEGLVGFIAQRRELLNLEDAPRHPRFHAVAELGDEDLHGFLGVPLIQQRRVLGVLSVQHSACQPFPTTDVDFLVTLATQLATVFNHLLLSDETQALCNPLVTGAPTLLQGLASAPGVALGIVTIPHLLADLDDVPHRPVQDSAAEIKAFRTVFARVEAELHEACERLAPRLPPAEREQFAAHRVLLGSDSLIADTLAGIEAGRWAPVAWRDAVLTRIRLLEQMGHPDLSARAHQIRDWGRRVLHHLRTAVAPKPAHATERYVLVAEEISVAHLAAVPQRQLAGLVCLHGSALSHVALLARALGIPAVMGLGEHPIGRLEGCEVIVDGYQGHVHLNPDSATRRAYHQQIAAEQQLVAELSQLRHAPAVTQDGERIPLYTKAGLLTDIPAARDCGADGIGLYRTEFVFMVRESFPSEEEQYGIYRHILAAFAPQPVVMRTLDIGGDKALPYFPINEKNPFLGWRGMRFTLDQSDIFLTQLRAMLRANADQHNLRILFPMVTTVEEVDDALRLLDHVIQELATEGLLVPRPPVGVMIEVPAAAWQADQLAQRADFLSVGTNDLAQYLLAVDRDNARVARLYDNLHPAMLKTIAHIIAASHRAGRPVNLSGELSSDPGAAVLLVGMGADSLNVSSISASRVKWALRSFSRAQAQTLAQQALTLDTVAQIHQLINEALRGIGLGRIVNPSD